MFMLENEYRIYAFVFVLQSTSKNEEIKINCTSVVNVLAQKSLQHCPN